MFTINYFIKSISVAVRYSIVQTHTLLDVDTVPDTNKLRTTRLDSDEETEGKKSPVI